MYKKEGMLMKYEIYNMKKGKVTQIRILGKEPATFDLYKPMTLNEITMICDRFFDAIDFTSISDDVVTESNVPASEKDSVSTESSTKAIPTAENHVASLKDIANKLPAEDKNAPKILGKKLGMANKSNTYCYANPIIDMKEKFGTDLFTRSDVGDLLKGYFINPKQKALYGQARSYINFLIENESISHDIQMKNKRTKYYRFNKLKADFDPEAFKEMSLRERDALQGTLR